MSERPHLGYSVYWGMLEPLGRSVLAPELELLSEHVRLTVVTWEKPELAGPDAIAEEEERWRALGVRWLPLTYRKKPPVVSSIMDARQGERTLERVHADDPFDALFGRALVGGLTATGAGQRIDRPVLYHTEGSWVDEQVDGGSWREGGIAHRAGRRLESRVLDRSAAVLALTEATLRIFRKQGRLRPEVPTAVVPNTSALADRARPDWLRTTPPEKGDWTVAYLGSVGGRYLLDDMLDFTAHLDRTGRLGRLLILAPRDHDLIRSAVSRAGLDHRLELRSVPFEQVPEELRSAHVGLFFLADGIAAPFVSATKVAEYLACGLAVVTTASSGDAPDQVAEANAGVVLSELGPEAWEPAARKLDRLLSDPELPRRAQLRAKAAYGPRRAVDRQVDLLRRVLARAEGRP